jgi:pimeloyl-ACP methyl ester carboxylesterase
MAVEYISPGEFLGVASSLTDVQVGERTAPPTPEFMKALANPELIEDEGVSHAAYTFNQHMADYARPLVVVRPTSTGVTNPIDSIWWNAFTQPLKRPVITIDLPATGRSETPPLDRCYSASMDSLAAATIRLLEKVNLQIDDVDLAGFCLGGIVAASMAAKLGERAHHLVTYGTPGFNRDILKRTLKVGGTAVVGLFSKVGEAEGELSKLGITEYSMSAQSRLALAGAYLVSRSLVAGRGKLNQKNKEAKMRDIPEAGAPSDELPRSRASSRERLVYMAGLCLSANNAPMQTMPNALHPNTTWDDIVGTADVFTAYIDHVPIVHRRNAWHPNSTTLTIMSGATHGLFFRPNEGYMAQDIERRLAAA